MSVVKKRLEKHQIFLPKPPTKNEFLSVPEQLRGYDIGFFRYLTTKHLLIHLEYTVACAALIHRLPFMTSDEINEEVVELLMLSEVLDFLYQYYLYIPKEVASFRKDKKLFRDYLIRQGYQFKANFEEKNPDGLMSKKVREKTFIYNFIRLISVRTRRFLILLTPITHSLIFKNFVDSMVWFTAKVVTHAGWIFFAPRLFVNLFHLFRHILPSNWWMSKEEKSLGFRVRLIAQLNRRWFELQNDFVWFNGGIILAVVLVGSFLPIALYFSAALQLYDVILAGFRAILEIHRLNVIKKEYQLLLYDPNYGHEVAIYLFHLEERILFEKKRVYLP